MDASRRPVRPTSATAYLDAILADMAERGVKPTPIAVIAAATDRGLASRTVTRISRLTRARLGSGSDA